MHFGLTLGLLIVLLIGSEPDAWALAPSASLSADLRWIALSPDGTRIAAVEPGSGVVVRRVPGGAVDYRVPLCTGCTLAGLAFTPDGARLAVLLHQAAVRTTQVALADGTGAPARVLTTIAGQAVQPRWSPEGRQLAFLATVLPRKEAGALQPGAPLTGEIGAVVDTQRVAVLPAEGGLARLVSPPGDYVYEFTWLPQGDGFAVVTAPGNGDAQWWAARLATVALGDGALRELYRPPLQQQITAPLVLADGQTLVFIAGLMSDLATASGDIWSVPLDGGAPARALTSGFAGSFTALARRGDELVATAILGDRMALLPVAADGRVGVSLWQRAASMGPLAFDARGETVALRLQDFDHASQVWGGPLAAPVPLPPAGDEAMAATARAWRAEALRWQHEGYELQGWLLLPREPTVPRALLMDLHGGPTAVALPEYAGEGVRAALLARGYALFLPNPRGSSGRGEAFKRLVVRDFGQGDFSDAMAGLDAALARTGVDRRRVGLMGASYGGFLAMWANVDARGRDRFAAIVAGAGIANWVSYAGQNGIGAWLQPFFGVSVYEDAGPYRAASPIERMRQAKTPTLLYVGERDIETPPAQSLEYWRALRTLGVESTLVVYAGEGHVLAQPSNLADLKRRIVAWFERYLP